MCILFVARLLPSDTEASFSHCPKVPFGELVLTHPV